ncbi:MAG: hypothetical protein MUC36_23100 [Planctomycetes bacterium]|jgi:hypothetical protein|nr:hypothetical protein [Planctomycetota bacterium]
MNNQSPSVRSSNPARLGAVAIAAAAAVVVVVLARGGDTPQVPSPAVTPAVAPAPSSAVSTSAAPVAPVRRVQLALHHAERFRVDRPFEHLWRADRPLVTTGWLLVVSGDPELLRPRQSKMPVLYVGAQTAERINAGTSGRLVLLVPGDFRLEDAPIFLGSEALPEELRQPAIDAELATAVAGGAIATPAATIKAVTADERGPFETDYELRQRAIDLVEIHSPTEKDLIAGWRVPRMR